MSEFKIKKTNRRWSAERVISEIKALKDRSAKFNQKTFPSLYGASIRHFGSWKKAVEAAGFPYEAISRKKATGYWDRERLVEAIQKLSEKHSNFVRKKHADLYSAALRIFGSWEKAVTASGFDYESIRKGWLEADATRLRFIKKR